MAIYHCCISVGSRSNGSSSVGSCAYREGSRKEDIRTGIIHDYSRKTDVIESCVLCPDHAPSFCRDSSQLWNEVERKEKRKDAQLFREVTVALPKEQTQDQNRELVLNYCHENFVSKGMIASISFHESKTENPHAHIMLTMRELTSDGFGQKNREWNSKSNLREWRENWAISVNRNLDKNDINQKIDHRSLFDQGILRTPQIHVGYAALEMEKRGEISERGQKNREIIQGNDVKSETIEQGIQSIRHSFDNYKREQAEIAVQEKALLEAQKNREKENRQDVYRGFSL